MTKLGDVKKNAKIPLWLIAISLLIIFPYFLTEISLADGSIFTEVVNPDEYTIGPGDIFRIDFWNGTTPPLELTVTPEGFLLLPSMGRADVGNLTLTEARTVLRNLVGKFYSDGDFSVTLLGSRSVKVLVSGGIRRPGLYDGLVSQRISEMINRAGGFAAGASHRNIILSGGNKEYVIDYLKYERAGDFTGNPYLYVGSRIYIPLVIDSTNFVQVSGEVTNPGGFEYKDGDNLGTLLALAMGVTGQQGDSVLIFRNGQTLSLPLIDSAFTIQPGDKLLVRKRTEQKRLDYFTVSGEIIMPGRFPFRDGLDLGNILKNAGGLTDRADIHSLVVYRKTESRDSSSSPLKSEGNNVAFDHGSQPVSINMPQHDPDQLPEIKIMPGDSIVVPALTGTIGVYGIVNRPGVLVYRGFGMSAGQAIALAGGYSKGADRGKLDIYRKGSGLHITAGSDIFVYDGDLVQVSAKENNRSFWDKVKDLSLILGGAGVVYLAIDNMSE